MATNLDQTQIYYCITGECFYDDIVSTDQYDLYRSKIVNTIDEVINDLTDCHFVTGHGCSHQEMSETKQRYLDFIASDLKHIPHDTIVDYSRLERNEGCCSIKIFITDQVDLIHGVGMIDRLDDICACCLETIEMDDIDTTDVGVIEE